MTTKSNVPGYLTISDLVGVLRSIYDDIEAYGKTNPAGYLDYKRKNEKFINKILNRNFKLINDNIDVFLDEIRALENKLFEQTNGKRYYPYVEMLRQVVCDALDTKQNTKTIKSVIDYYLGKKIEIDNGMVSYLLKWFKNDQFVIMWTYYKVKGFPYQGPGYIFRWYGLYKYYDISWPKGMKEELLQDFIENKQETIYCAGLCKKLHAFFGECGKNRRNHFMKDFGYQFENPTNLSHFCGYEMNETIEKIIELRARMKGEDKKYVCEIDLLLFEALAVLYDKPVVSARKLLRFLRNNSCHCHKPMDEIIHRLLDGHPRELKDEFLKWDRFRNQNTCRIGCPNGGKELCTPLQVSFTPGKSTQKVSTVYAASYAGSDMSDIPLWVVDRKTMFELTFDPSDVRRYLSYYNEFFDTLENCSHYDRERCGDIQAYLNRARDLINEIENMLSKIIDAIEENEVDVESIEALENMLNTLSGFMGELYRCKKCEYFKELGIYFPASLNLNPSGVFLHKPHTVCSGTYGGGICILDTLTGVDYTETLNHELAHAYMHHNKKKIINCKWIEEGLADYLAFELTYPTESLAQRKRRVSKNEYYNYCAEIIETEEKSPGSVKNLLTEWLKSSQAVSYWCQLIEDFKMK